MDRTDNMPTPSQSIFNGQIDVVVNNQIPEQPSPRHQQLQQQLDPNPEQQTKKLGFSIEEILRRNSHPSTPPPQQQNSDHEDRESAHYVTAADGRCRSRDDAAEDADVTFGQHSDEEEGEDGDCLLTGGEDLECGGDGYSWLHCTRYKPPKLPRSKRKDTNKKRKLGRNPRVPFTQHQVSVLEQKFRQTHYLSSVDVAELSATLNLTETRVKIWFQNRRARERRDKTSPSSMDKDLNPGHFKERSPETVTSLPGESRLPSKYSSPSEEQFKAMSGGGGGPHHHHHPFNVLHTAWGGVYHPLHGLFGIRPLSVQPHYDGGQQQQQRALAQQRMLALQRHSAFTPVIHGLNAPSRQVSSTD